MTQIEHEERVTRTTETTRSPGETEPETPDTETPETDEPEPEGDDVSVSTPSPGEKPTA